MIRRAVVLSLVLYVIDGSLVAQPPPELPQKGAGPGKPLSPKDAQKLFKIDDGLRIELVACEPQIESPVAMAFDPDGRLWVVEMRDYPNGPAKGEKPMGRIRILEDKDGDGFFETSTIWADNLLFANGLFLWKDGAIVTKAPHILQLRDTTGAGKANKIDILYEGFAAQNPQLRVSHPILGLDGWIYCANGLRGGSAVRVNKDKQYPAVNLSGMDFRFDPVHLDQYEAITGPGQYGNTFDAWGNRFICDNRHHLRHVVMEQRYVKRNPYLAAPALVEDISVLEDGPLNSGGRVYPISKNWTTSSLHEGRFTAACGVFIYHGQLLDTSRKRERRDERDEKNPVANASGSFYNGAAFTCEPTGNLVHMEILTPKGATFTAKPHKQGVEFLASTDDWFRPVFLTHGPEGAMYVVDMYRAVIEHPEFMPPELKNRPDLWAGKDKGRIWRIVPKDHRTKTLRPNLSKASIAELVKTLEHEEPWYRTTAQRLLLEQNDKGMIEPLTKLFTYTKSPHAKILAAWVLERHGKLSDKRVMDLCKHENPHVREHGIRIAEPRLDRVAVLGFGLADVEDENREENERVRFQTILAISGMKHDAGVVGASRMATRSKNDRWALLAAQSSLPEHSPVLLFMFLKQQAPPEMIRSTSALVVTQKEHDPLYVDLFQRALKQDKALKWAALAGFADGLERRGKTLITILKDADYLADIGSQLSAAGSLARDVKQPVDRRLLCLRVVSHAPWPTAKESLVPLVEKEPIQELRFAALRALAGQQDEEVPALLLKLWPSASPSVRREILEAMLRQPARISVLLDEIESKRMKASELDPLRTRQLANHKNPAIRDRAKKLLADNVPADRQTVLKEYQAALKLKGDTKNGREIFKKNCATCHRVGGIGVDVGPDIADTRTKTLEALLFDIIVPNAAIDANYVNYVVSTKDGRILTGLLTAESASSITLKRAENQTDVVLRKDVDEIASTGISLMPEGLEKSINVQEMADLLLFLKNWRYLDGSVPVGK
jgi:putative membrane-bound dehydrogenase-like protein